MSHSQRCIDANRFGDGFDCICDQEPLPRALAEVDRLSKALEAAEKRYAAAEERIKELETELRSKYTFNPVHYAEYGSEGEAMSAAQALAKNSEIIVDQGKRIEELTAELANQRAHYVALETSCDHWEALATDQGAELAKAREQIAELTVQSAAHVTDMQNATRALDTLSEENNALVQQVAMLRAYQRKTDEAIRSVALFIEADEKAGLRQWLRRGIVRIVRGDPRPAPCPECKVTGGHKMSCGLAPEPIRRMRAKLKAGTLRIEYGGRDGEIEYLRGAIEKELDPDVRQRMQKRLAYVESKTDAELMANFLEPDEPEGPTQ